MVDVSLLFVQAATMDFIVQCGGAAAPKSWVFSPFFPHTHIKSANTSIIGQLIISLTLCYQSDFASFLFHSSSRPFHFFSFQFFILRCRFFCTHHALTTFETECGASSVLTSMCLNCMWISVLCRIRSTTVAHASTHWITMMTKYLIR